MLAPVINHPPVSQEEKKAILEQLERLLGHAVFKSSRRCPIFLRHVVTHALEGQADQPVKERTIGVEVFGREAGYDTNHDPIVRITAGEVRKRIAQYYHEPGHDAEVRIELPAGSYVPEFFFSSSDSSPGFMAAPAVEEPPPIAAPVRARSAVRLEHRMILVSIILLVGLVACVLLFERVHRANPRSALDQFWNSTLASSAPVLLCIGQPPDASTPAARVDESVDDFVRQTDHIALSDGTALADLAGFLGKRGKSYRLQGSGSTSLTDLRQGTSILIAGFDNSWTLRATDSLRFHFVRTGSNRRIFAIEDREKPSRNWSIDYDMPYSRMTEDFAIVARFVNTATDQAEVIAAGIGENGTISAGEFITDARFLQQIADRAPRDWAHKNLEAVIATQVIDEKSGPPRLLAVYFW